MSCSEYISRIAAGDHSFCAIPVFPSRSFRHSFITINKKSGIEKPTDLFGKRIGVPLYTMTAAVWIRGHLIHDYQVDLSQVKWVQGSINSPTPHGEPTVMPMHQPISIEINDSKSSLSDLLRDQKIDAIIGTTLPNCIKPIQISRGFFLTLEISRNLISNEPRSFHPCTSLLLREAP
jgi:4,5-dihydroxyphthalate decarboxylase